MYFLRFPEVTVVGASPEPMVRLRDGVVISRPIAGSRPRGENEQHDRLLEGELAEDPKELAEHIMLVDLARNDVGRVVRFGTEKVDELMTIERYSHIMHITSQVSGELAEGKGPIDVLRATLPAGTLSGAPKVRAMEIIDELEPTKRGVYGGVVGYIDFSGNVDTAIAIRTMVVTPDGRASVQAGAGIVADSDPQSEDEECAHKAGALLVAVTAARRMSAARAAVGAGRVVTATPPDSLELDAETEALRHGAGAFRAGRDVLAVRGPDAESYLQGQLSQDVAALAVGASADSLLLEPDGKLSALLRVTRTDGQGFVLDVDGGYGEAVVARLRRFLLRSKVELEQLRLALPVPAGRRGRRGGGGPADGAGRAGRAGAALRVERLDRRRPARPRGRRARAGDAALPDGVTACGADAVEACRIVSGIPAMGTELTAKTIAAEAGLVERTVSFTKGCYTGQELVARIDSRGSNVARRLVGVVAPGGPAGDGGPLADPGMTLHAGEAPAGDGAAEDKVVGTVTSAAWSTELGAWVGPRLPAPQRGGARPGPGALGRRHRRLAPGPGGAAAAEPVPTPPPTGATARAERTAAPVPAAQDPAGHEPQRTEPLRQRPGWCWWWSWRRTPCVRHHHGLHPLGQHRSRRSRSSSSWSWSIVRWPLRRPARSSWAPDAGHPCGLGGRLRRRRGVGAGRVRRPGQPGRPSDAELHARRGRPLLRPEGPRVLRLAVPRRRHRAPGAAPAAASPAQDASAR